jgi:DNA polymerase III subunit delta
MPAAKTGQKIAPIHAILGSDEFEVKRVAFDLAQSLSPGGDFGLETIDGAADNLDQALRAIHSAIESLQTFGMFGGEKLVWMKNVNFLADTVVGRSESVIAALEKLLKILQGGLPEGTRFLLSATETDKRRTFYKSLCKIANVQTFDGLDSSKAGWEESASMLVQDMALKLGLHMDHSAAEMFTLYTGGDRRTITTELEKLNLYLGSTRRDVTLDDIRLLTPISRAGVVFELGNAIASRQLTPALDLLKQLIFQGENEMGIILVAVIPTVRNLLLVKDLMVRHKLTKPAQPFFFGKTLERLPGEAIAHLPRNKEGKLNAYPLGIAASHAHRYTIPELRRALSACLDANVALVTSPTEKEVILNQLIVRIIAS